eukprot:SAG25_NODE_152_length_13602_cov_15.382878_9_plen_183_part_00
MVPQRGKSGLSPVPGYASACGSRMNPVLLSPCWRGVFFICRSRTESILLAGVAYSAFYLNKQIHISNNEPLITSSTPSLSRLRCVAGSISIYGRLLLPTCLCLTPTGAAPPPQRPDVGTTRHDHVTTAQSQTPPQHRTSHRAHARSAIARTKRTERTITAKGQAGWHLLAGGAQLLLLLILD